MTQTKADETRKQAEKAGAGPDIENARRITSLADLPGRETVIRIDLENGEPPLEFPGKTLTYKRWNELGRMIPDPEPSSGGFDKMGRPIYNFHDQVYLAKKGEAEDQRMYYRLVEFLSIDIPGDTLDEQVEALANAIEFRLMRALLNGIGMEHLKVAEVSVSARAVTFPAA